MQPTIFFPTENFFFPTDIFFPPRCFFFASAVFQSCIPGNVQRFPGMAGEISLKSKPQIPLNHRFRPVGVRPNKKLFQRKLREIVSDSVVTFFWFLGHFSCADQKGPYGAGCLLRVASCCLLLVARRASSILVSNNSINWLKYYELQLGDPRPLTCAFSWFRKTTRSGSSVASAGGSALWQP